jgi:hypothetical protein
MTSTPNNFGQAQLARDEDVEVITEGFTNVSASGLNAPEMDLMTLGTGMAISQSASNLVLTTGTSTNSEFLARSKKAVDGTWAVRLNHILSQRIANNNFVLMLACKIGDSVPITINSATTITVNLINHGYTTANVGGFMNVGGIVGAAGVPGRYAIASIVDNNNFTMTVAGWPASGSCTANLFGCSYSKIAFSGTTATSASFDTQRSGWASGDTTITINTTASPGHIIQMHNDGRGVYVEDAVAASSTAAAFTTRGSRIDHIPPVKQPMYLYMWAYNGSTAPASTTTWTVGYWSIETFPNKPMFIAGTRQIGQSSPQPISGSVTATVASTTVTSISAGANLIGDVGLQPRATAGGYATVTRLVSAAASTNATVVKAAAGRVYMIRGYNAAAAVRYLKIYNKATAPTVGTDTPILTFALKPSDNFDIDFQAIGYYFATGIGFALTTGSADADTGALTAADVVGMNVIYS